MPYHQRDSKENDDMLQQDVIEASSGPWSFPIVLDRKKDGTLRFCVDFRRVNDVTKKEVHPLPRIDETLDMLDGAKWISTLDATGKWKWSQNIRRRQLLVHHLGLTRQFKVMPFRFSNAPSTFQKPMEMVLAGLYWTMCLVYLNDFVIFSTSVEQHLSRLRDVLARLKKAGLKLKPSKLHALTEKLKPWEWTRLCDEAFVKLKTKFSSPPILSFPQFNMQFTVDCDARLEGLGAALSQENDSSTEVSSAEKWGFV